MSVSKITISINHDLLGDIDHLVRARIFSSRSQAIQSAVQEKISRMHKTRLSVECAKLDPAEEQALAETGLSADIDLWPEY